MTKKDPKLEESGNPSKEDKDSTSIYGDDLIRNLLLPSVFTGVSEKTGELESNKETSKKNSTSPYKLEIELKITNNEDGILTPYSLEFGLSPYLQAISHIQNIIRELLGLTSRLIRLEKITQNSPISVGLDGVAEAVSAIQEIAIPWRRKHFEKMALLQEREKMAEIEILKAETLEKHALADKSRAEAIKLSAEAIKQRSEAERINLENEKLRLELHRAKIQLALDFLNHLSPKLSETEKISYLMKLMPPLEVIIQSELEITSVQPKTS